MLLHNNGCWIADLADPRWYLTDRNGELITSFCFPVRVYRDRESGLWVTDGESGAGVWRSTRFVGKVQPRTLYAASTLLQERERLRISLVFHERHAVAEPDFDCDVYVDADAFVEPVAVRLSD